MANFLASIFGTELDKVNCSFYFVSPTPKRVSVATPHQITDSMRAHLENWCLSSRRSLLAKACQAFLQSDHSYAQPLPEPCVRSQEPNEPISAPEPLRRLLRGYLV